MPARHGRSLRVSSRRILILILAVALADFKAGALLQQGMFVDPTVAQTSFADRLEAEKGKHAISISVDQVHGVGGFITPGDYVNLIVEVKPVALGQAAA